MTTRGDDDAGEAVRIAMIPVRRIGVRIGDDRAAWGRGDEDATTTPLLRRVLLTQEEEARTTTR